MIEITEYVKKIYQVFEESYDSIDLPFFYSFPINCCESASIILGYLIQGKFPTNRVEVIKGVNDKDEGHFWVEVDGSVYDITVHQFDKIEKPIFGSSTHPLSNEFKEVSRVKVIQFVVRNECVDLDVICSIFPFLNGLIEAG